MKIKSVNGTVTTISVYNESKVIREITTDSGTSTTNIKDYVYAFKELQLIVDNDVKTYYYSDILGSTRFITNDADGIVQENIFEPFGKELLHSCEVEDCIYTYQFAGHNGENKETGMIDMKARWMDTETGRFISPDPAMQGINWYVYAQNNPTTFIDPSGLYTKSSFKFNYSSFEFNNNFDFDNFGFNMLNEFNSFSSFDPLTNVIFSIMQEWIYNTVCRTSE